MATLFPTQMKYGIQKYSNEFYIKYNQIYRNKIKTL